MQFCRSRFAKTPAARAEKIDRLEQLVRRDRGRGSIMVTPARGRGEEQAEMLPQTETRRQLQVPCHLLAQFARRSETDTEQIKARGQRAPFEHRRGAPKWDDDHRWAAFAPGRARCI